MSYARLQVADAVVETRASSRRKALGRNLPVAMALTFLADMHEPRQSRNGPNCENLGVDPVTGIAYYTWQAHLSVISAKTEFTVPVSLHRNQGIQTAWQSDSGSFNVHMTSQRRCTNIIMLLESFDVMNVCPPTTFNNEHCISKCFWR